MAAQEWGCESEPGEWQAAGFGQAVLLYLASKERREREREGEKESYRGQARGETEANRQEEWKRAQRNERQAIKRLISVRQSRAAAGTNFSAASRHQG